MASIVPFPTRPIASTDDDYDIIARGLLRILGTYPTVDEAITEYLGNPARLYREFGVTNAKKKYERVENYAEFQAAIYRLNFKRKAVTQPSHHL